MTHRILGFLLTCALAAAPASAQTAGTKPAAPAQPATPTSKPATQKPATQKPATQKPATPQKPGAKPATPASPTAKPKAPAAATATAPAMSAAKHGAGTYALFTTNKGNFIARLFDKDAPNTVQNFVGLAEGKKQWKDPRTGRMIRRPYYNNVLFHRVIPNFMIQGGDPEGTGMGGPGFTFPDEISPKHRHDKPGILSMANRGPNTNGGQFFITVAPYPSLDGHYSIFGEIVEGQDVVNAISQVPRAERDRPVTPVTIKQVKIERVS
jgi:peptidyl-prolyl cis-trans isomerase A (cyclophilin A)